MRNRKSTVRMSGMKSFIQIPVTMQYGNREVATFGLLPDRKVYHGQNTVSNVGDIPKVDLSYLENISEPAETLTIRAVQESQTEMVKYSSKHDIVGEDLKKHISILSVPANIPAIEYFLKVT